MAPDKITFKNLQFDQNLPPFLARLKGQHAADARSPDPLLAARRRKGGVRSASAEAEDAPLIVDERGNVVDLKAVQPVQGDAGKAGAASDEQDDDGRKADAGGEEKEKVAIIGAAKRRQLGRVVGGQEKGVNDRAMAQAMKASKIALDASDDTSGKRRKAPADKSGAKKAKKIKLSFGDEDEG